MPSKKNTTKDKRTREQKNKKYTGKNERFLLLVFAALVLFVGIGYFYYSSPKQKQEVLAQAVVEEKPVPVYLATSDTPQFSAHGIYAFDVNSGEVLFSKNPDDPLLPASTTKIATALVAMRAYQPQDVLKVKGIGNVSGQKMGLFEGEMITAESLIYGTLIHSANDAAVALANNHPGGSQAFVQAMNQLAQDWGLAKTHFTNPVGFDQLLHFSTARDLAMLARQAMEDPEFAKIVGMQNAVVTSADGKTVHRLVNTNQLLGDIPGVVGVKTGHTVTSGESLVTLVDKDGKKVLISVIGSDDRFGETKSLLGWIFANYSWEKKKVTLN